ncbi:MAG: insulinase family protein [Saprospirales bacterium]|nr:MAG: insulinase family protein [Saprospirales bacterium]
MRNIKQLFSLVLILFLSHSLLGQVLDRSVQPAPGPAPTIQIGEFESFTLENGLTVIVVENDKSPTISWQLTLNVDPPMEGDAAGYVSMAGSEMRSGTTNRDKATIDEEIDFIGASLSTSSRGMFASSLSRHTETLLDLMSDVLLNPTFPQEELDRAITQMLSGLSTVSTDPNSMVSNMMTALLYGPNHPYGEVTTDETVKNITRDMLVSYYETYWKPNVAYLVIVGDITTERAKELVETHFGSWEPGVVPEKNYDLPAPPEANRVAFANRAGAVQTVFRVAYPIELTPGHPDLVKVRVMNSILGGGVFSGRLMQNLREDKGYTYGARSNISTDRLIASFSAGAEVGNNVTDSAITEVLYEMNRLVVEPVDEETLQLVKNFMNGSFARSLESPRTIANFALNIKRYNLPDDYYATYLERLEAVTVDDVQEMAKRYIKPDNAWIIAAGSLDEVAPKLAVFSHTGEVEVFDHFARPIEALDVEIGDDVTAEWVLEQYLEAIGSRERIEAIEDFTQRMSAEVMGSQMESVSYKKPPYRFKNELAVGGSVMQQEIFNTDKGFMSAMGQRIETEESEIESKRIESAIIQEMAYLEAGLEMELRGVDNVNDRPSYRIRIHLQDGTPMDVYFDMETHLKTRDVVTVEQMGQTTTITNDYENYKEFDGILMPTMVRISGLMPIAIEMKTESVEINTGLSDDLFKVN